MKNLEVEIKSELHWVEKVQFEKVREKPEVKCWYYESLNWIGYNS